MRKLALILLVGIIVVAYANIADNLGENKLRTKSQMTSSSGMWLEHPKMKETLIRPTPNTNSTVITEAVTALNMAKFDGDPNLALRNEKVANWYTYGNWGSPYYLTWVSPERATMFVPAEFGIAYPCTISKVKTQFYQHPSYPWPGSNYTFKIYADDGSTLLWQSENLIAQQYPNVCSTDVTPNVVITSGNFYVAVCPAEGQNGFPSTLADNVTEGRSFYGQPGNWTAWTSGEFFISAYVSFRQINWDMRTVSINAPAWTTPYQKFSISALFKNLGVNTVSPNVPVKMRITGPEGYLYQDLNERTRNTLAQNDTERVYFSPQWQAPNVLGTYTVKVWCELAGDENPINDTAITTIEVTNWLTYAEWDDLTWATWAGPERMVWIVPSEFGVLHPITIDTLKAAFMWITRPWKDSTFKFKIYAGDGMTLLYESDTIRVTPPVGVWEYTIVKHAVNPPVTINSGTFCVAIAPRVDSMPFSAGSETLPGRPKRSFYGSPGSEAWTLSSRIEYAISPFVSWQPRN
ncbi:MAG: hypothetical protein N2748_04350, partial [candidate division WOR-3 bacterium]|nr:hypothetical protein [candidate division WOR-3 bacterium]